MFPTFTLPKTNTVPQKWWKRQTIFSFLGPFVTFQRLLLVKKSGVYFCFFASEFFGTTFSGDSPGIVGCTLIPRYPYGKSRIRSQKKVGIYGFFCPQESQNEKAINTMGPTRTLGKKNVLAPWHFSNNCAFSPYSLCQLRSPVAPIAAGQLERKK